MNGKRWVSVWLVVVGCVLAGGVSAQGDDTSVRVWYPAAAPDLAAVGVDQTPFDDQLAAFNATRPEVVVAGEAIPRDGYLDHIRAASLAGELPCVLALESYYTASFAASGDLRIVEHVAPEVIDDLLPGAAAQGLYEGRRFGVLPYTHTLALWGNRPLLEAAGVKLPTVDAPWTRDDFDAALAALAGVVPPDGYALDLNLAGGDEWLFRALTPWLWSFGGELVDRAAYTTAEGFINGPEAQAFGVWWQGLFKAGYATTTSNNGPADFAAGRVALSLAGPWAYPAYQAALGDRLVLLPMPDLGSGPRTTAWGTTWAITTTCEQQDGAEAVLAFVLTSQQIATAAQANQALPGSETLLADDKRYAPGGELAVFAEQLARGWADELPGTRVTPALVTAWGQALRAMAEGADVPQALDAAAGIIDAAIQRVHDEAVR